HHFGAAEHLSVELDDCSVPVSSTLGNLLERTSQAAPRNGIFVVGDRRPKTCLRDETYAQRRKSRPHNREKLAENRHFRRQVFHGECRWTGWWRMQPSETGLGQPLPCYSLLFDFSGARIPPPFAAG